MEIVSPPSPPLNFAGKDRCSELYWKLSDDFSSKLKIGFTDEEEEDRHINLERSGWNHDEIEDKTDDLEEGEEDEGEDFTFASINAENSPITAEEAFEDGQIRPVYPFNWDILFDYERDYDPKEKSKVLRSPLKKLFVEREVPATSTAKESEPLGPYCSLSGRTVEEVSPETCRKSNSTGFSKLWRFRDLVRRSNSDGRDAFVYMSNGYGSDKKQIPSSSTAAKKTEKVKKTKTEKKMKTKSAHEKLYMKNREMREEGKRRSYLPYKNVGFFSNVSGFTRNLHPF